MNLMEGGKDAMLSIASTGGLAWSKIRKENPELEKKFRKISSDTFKETMKLGKIKRCNWTGRKHSKETIDKMAHSHMNKHNGKLNSQFDTCWITNGIINKKIKKCDVNKYLEINWYKGRTIINIKEV